MPTPDQPHSVVKRLDRLYEFDREPVSTDKLCGGAYFAGSFAGEHVAATEFVIGALFVTWGTSVADVVVGLAIGNLLAVLSWALVCAPIAVQTRLTLYWYLRKIGGPFLTLIYNVLNAALFCVLAGCMITVSATAAVGRTSSTESLPRPGNYLPGAGSAVAPTRSRSRSRYSASTTSASSPRAGAPTAPCLIAIFWNVT
jgi:hypothetical protein